MFKTVTQHGSFNTTSKPKPRERFKPEIQLKGTILFYFKPTPEERFQSDTQLKKPWFI